MALRMVVFALQLTATTIYLQTVLLSTRSQVQLPDFVLHLANRVRFIRVNFSVLIKALENLRQPQTKPVKPTNIFIMTLDLAT